MKSFITLDTSFDEKMLSPASEKQKMTNFAKKKRKDSCPECSDKAVSFSDLQGLLLQRFLDCNSCLSEAS
jgi:hypothetical protein